MKLGLDFDGVIADCGRLKSDGIKHLYGKSISSEQFRKELVVGEGHLALEEYRQLQKFIYMDREFALRVMEPVVGVLHYIPKLIEANYGISVITSRGAEETEIAREWAESHGLDLQFVSVGYGNSKARALEGFDVYVDDDLDKLEPLVGSIEHLFLFSWGYNQDLDEGMVAQRISSWPELYQLLVGLQ